MLAAQRHALILAAVRAQGVVPLSALARRLGVTPVTVRRDVTALADQGLVERVHGGVTLPRRAPQPEAAPPRSAFGALAPRALVGMVTPSVDYYWPQVIQGAQTAAAAAEARLVLRGSSYDPADDRVHIAKLVERGVQALLVAPSTAGQAGVALLRWLGSLPIPVVLMERLPPPKLATLAMDSVVTAHAFGAGLAVRHLVTLGHDRIGLVTSRYSPTSHALGVGWAETSELLGLPSAAHEIVPAYGSAGWAEEYDALLLRSMDAGLRALVVHSDREAIGVLERARELGLTVPGDLAVVSYDDEVAAASDPPVTAVRPAKHQLGAIAAELALARLAGGAERPVHRVELWPLLVIRESCGSAPEPPVDTLAVDCP
jgi:DNA-binding LacI/PurR family transcriptional regulator